MNVGIILIPTLLVSSIVNAQQKPCSYGCESKSRKVEITCKLTALELRERKATVIASLKKQLKEKKELKNGYSYRFSGSDDTVDELASFIKTERLCCDFFTFNLSISGDKSAAWLEIVGPNGAKDFIKTELEL